jgi:hypothetical protein
LFAAAVIASILLASGLSFSAARKLTHDPGVVAAYGRAGVPEAWLDRLALLLFCAAAGLLIGLVWAPLGMITATCLIAYFAAAISFHVRAGDSEGLPTPVAMELLAVAVLIGRVATL